MIHPTPLFIPLKAIWFDAFARGERKEEWRRYGGRWTERTCYRGRRVNLVRGYSGDRLSAVIHYVTVREATEAQEAADIFGPEAKCLVLTLADIRPVSFGVLR